MRRIVSVTGTRADYGLMEPVHRAIGAQAGLELHLVVTGLHFAEGFAASLAQVRSDRLGALHELPPAPDDDSGAAMARAIGEAARATASLFQRIAPQVVLLQGDRGEMLAAAIAAAHMNLAIVHMSGGDRSGSIDDAVRDAISRFAHFHLTSCRSSTERLASIGESVARIVQVGDPALDQLRTLDFLPLEALQGQIGLRGGRPFVVATLHPVSDEPDRAGAQMTVLLEALERSGVDAVCTYPNNDAGSRAMREVLESWRGREFIRIVPTLGSRVYLSLLRHAAAVVGNSSSGIVESPSLRIPAINVGTRQFGRLRAANVIDVPFERDAIVGALRFALRDEGFRARVQVCENPYGDGHAAERTVDILRRLRLGPALTAKWRDAPGPLLDV